MGAALDEVWGPEPQASVRRRAAPGSKRAGKAPRRPAAINERPPPPAGVALQAASARAASRGDRRRTTAPDSEACQLFQNGGISPQLRDAMDAYEDAVGACPPEYDMAPFAPFDPPCSAEAAGFLAPPRPPARAAEGGRREAVEAAARGLPAMPDWSAEDAEDFFDDGGGVDPPGDRAPVPVPLPTPTPPLPLPLPQVTSGLAAAWARGADVLLYVASGVLLIFLMDQFTQMGAQMGAATAASPW